METNKTVWIIGASTGIGKSLAEFMHYLGYKIVISARSKDKLDAISQKDPENLIPVSIDVTDIESVKTAFDKTKSEIGRIDYAVICAGSYIRDNPYRFDRKVYEDTFNLNVMGTINCLQFIVPDMIAQESGTIGVVSSVAGINGLPLAAAYGGSKAALINICESLSPALKRKNIDLKIINPGFVATPLTEKNDFPMPFLIDAEESSRSIYKGLTSKKFEIIYPWKMAWLMKFIHALPYFIKFKLTSLVLKK